MTMETNQYGVKAKYELAAGGGKFETQIYPAEDAVDLLPFMLSIASGPAGMVVELMRTMMMEADVMAGDVSGQNVREGLLTLAKQIVEHGGSSKIKEVLKFTSYTHPGVEGVKNCSQDFGTVFQGRQGLLFKILAWVLEVNYLPFLRDGLSESAPGRLMQWAGKWRGVLNTLQSNSTSPPESGSSSDLSEKKDSISTPSNENGPSTTS